MKTLQEFVLDRLDNFYAFENLEVIDSVYDHLCIEYDMHLNEARGIPNGIRHDSVFITQLIEDRVKNGEENFSFDVPLNKLELDIFNNLTVNIKADGNTIDANFAFGDSDGEYVINILLPDKANIDEIAGDVSAEIGHELLHIFTYAQEQKKDHTGSKFLSRLKNISYYSLFNTKKEIDIDIDKEAEITGLTKEQVLMQRKTRNFVKSYIYASNEDELNAFIAQITLEIEAKHPDGPQEAIKLLHNNEIYMTYLRLMNYFNAHKLTQEQKDYLCKFYRSMIKSAAEKTNQEILHSIRNRIKHIQHRIEKILPRICYESKRLMIYGGKKMLTEMYKDSERYRKEYHLT